MGKPSITEELGRLYELLEKGALTQEEYDAQKAKLLNEPQENAGHKDTASTPSFSQPFIVQNTPQPLHPITQPIKNNNILLIAMAIFALAVMGAVAWFYAQPQRVPTVTVTSASEATSASAPKNNNKNKLSPEELQKTLSKTKKIHTAANIRLNIAWGELDNDLKTTLKKEQISWNRHKQADCLHTPSSQSVKIEKEISRLSCETDMINERIDILHEKQIQLLPRIKAAKLKAVHEQSTRALAGLNKTWATLPDSVQQQLGQDFNQWAEQTNARCTGTAPSDSRVQQKINYNICLINAVKAKNKELTDYKI